MTTINPNGIVSLSIHRNSDVVYDTNTLRLEVIQGLTSNMYYLPTVVDQVADVYFPAVPVEPATDPVTYTTAYTVEGTNGSITFGITESIPLAIGQSRCNVYIDDNIAGTATKIGSGTITRIGVEDTLTLNV